jgi:hypothetical protein
MRGTAVQSKRIKKSCMRIRVHVFRELAQFAVDKKSGCDVQFVSHEKS